MLIGAYTCLIKIFIKLWLIQLLMELVKETSPTDCISVILELLVPIILALSLIKKLMTYSKFPSNHEQFYRLDNECNLICLLGN